MPLNELTLQIADLSTASNGARACMPFSEIWHIHFDPQLHLSPSPHIYIEFSKKKHIDV